MKGDTWQKTIIVKQPTADKFTVESIVYRLGDDGAESIYWKDSPKREVEVTDAAAKVVLNPYDFASVYSQFKSDDVNSFYWVSAFDAPEVKIPHGISSKDGELYYVDKETFSYCSQVRSSINFMDINKGAKYETLLAKGTHSYRFSLEMKQIETKYVLTIKNVRTGELKVIKGQWIGSRPTGIYKFVLLN